MSVNNSTIPNSARVKELQSMQNGYLTRLVEGATAEAAKGPDKHYNNLLKLKVTPKDLDRGYVSVRLDPYLIGKVCGVLGGAMEHILKKALRGAKKGHTENEVFAEIICCAEGGIRTNNLTEGGDV